MTLRALKQFTSLLLCLIVGGHLGGCVVMPGTGAPVEDRSARLPPRQPLAPEIESSETIPFYERGEIQPLGPTSMEQPFARTDVLEPDRVPTGPGESAGGAGEQAPRSAERAQAAEPAPRREGSVWIPEQGGAQGTPAVVALLEDAGRQARSGSLDSAAAALERAVRIEPRNAAIWSRLAEVRLQQQLSPQAENLAKKSNTLAGRDTRLRARNWRIIARARQIAGDSAGAAEAEQQAAMLEAGAR
jgi:predicted Zn-dependent protease